MSEHIDLSHAADDTEALLLRSLSVLTDQLNQARGDREVLAGAIRDIEKHAANVGDSILALDSILYLCRLPAVRDAMEGVG